MLAFAYANLPHVLCALLLLARIGDVGTTFLLTPSLELEANPIIRKLGWRFALLTLAACALPYLPYLGLPVAAMVSIPFLLVSASNAAKIWIVRAVGEKAYASFLVDVARKSKLSHALIGVAASSFFIALAGATILLFYPAPANWGFWLGGGVVLYAVVIWFYGTLWMMRLFRQAALPRELAGAAETRA